MQHVSDSHDNKSPAAELQRLMAEHRELNERVDQLEHQTYLTPEEEREVHQLKKLKLQKKDLIEDLRHRGGL